MEYAWLDKIKFKDKTHDKNSLKTHLQDVEFQKLERKDHELCVFIDFRCHNNYRKNLTSFVNGRLYQLPSSGENSLTWISDIAIRQIILLHLPVRDLFVDAFVIIALHWFLVCVIARTTTKAHPWFCLSRYTNALYKNNVAKKIWT